MKSEKLKVKKVRQSLSESSSLFSFSSLHTHTKFCHGADDVETMCRAAYEKGLAAIGFSTHASVDKIGIQSDWNMKSDRLGLYVDEVNAARRRWEEKLPVYLGLEVDYIKGLRSALDKDIQDVKPDYLISSVHFLVPPRGAPFTVDGSMEEIEKGITESYAGDGEAMMNAYWDTVIEMVSLGGFDIVGHLDLVKKNNAADRLFNTKAVPAKNGQSYSQRVNEVAHAISAAGIVVEVNTGGINRGYISETYPSPAILRLLQQLKIPVMISADAHCAKDLDGNYPLAVQTLHDAGYTSHVLFEGRREGKAVWRKE
jgi:histidinol-phosphatase (PHP family)